MIFRPAANDMVFTTVMAVILQFVLAIVNLRLFFKYRGQSIRYLLLAAACFLFLMLAGSLEFRIRGYEVSPGNLAIQLGFSHKIYSLASLRDVALIKAPFAGAKKDFANAGMWSCFGHFSSPYLGKFDAYTTERSQGVLLTWPDQKLVVTPADAEQFVQSVKSAK